MAVKKEDAVVERILELLDSTDLDYKAIAERTGVSISTVCRYKKLYKTDGNREKGKAEAKKKEDKELCSRISCLRSEGKAWQDICNEVGISWTKLLRIRKEYGVDPKRGLTPGKKEPALKGEEKAFEPNHDRHLCKSCKYRASNEDYADLKMRCNYIGIKKHSRGCDVENCNKYEKGKRQKAAVRAFRVKKGRR